jgi:glycosyltransferase involved in cell wall biosynthesis
MVILTNADALPATWTAANGAQGRTVIAGTFFEALRNLRRCDLVLINSDPRLLLKLSALFTAMPWVRRPLLACVTVLRKPETLAARLLLAPKRFLLSGVDHFLHHFTDLSGYEKYFAIGAGRSSFVPFKPNLRYRCSAGPSPDGEYVLCMGHSLRDYDTFFDAVERLPYPAAIPEPDPVALRRHGSRFTRAIDQLPPQVRRLPHNPANSASQVEILSGARLVVVPLLRSCLVQAGTPYNAMLLGKCVIVTEGPATHGLFTDEVLTVPPEDPRALAEVIDRAWKDNQLREKTAAAGYRLALAMGGEPELAQRMIDAAAAWYAGHVPAAFRRGFEA